MIALVDCNNFYASCERLFAPKLERMPIVVLSNNDGCVIARSEEAKEIGIEMGAPAFLMEEMLAKNNVAVFSSNYTLYGSLSERVIKILSSFVTKIEVYSIDEAFLDLSDFKYQDLFEYGMLIKQTIKEYLGIPVTIGIAPTKTLAKMANRYAKKKRKEAGVHWLNTPGKIQEILNYTEIKDVWGIGAQHERRLRWKGIKNAADFIKLNPDWVRKEMTVVGERLLNELQEIPCIEWEDMPAAKKGICTARSFGNLLSKKEDIIEAAANYAANCAAKLRKQKTCANLVTFFLQTNVFRTGDKQYSRTINMQLPEARKNSTHLLIKYALQCLDKIFRPGYNYKKAGVMVFDLVPEANVQLNIFNSENRNRNGSLMISIDKINNVLGKDLVRFASQGYARKWKLRQEKLSPCYTTNINHVLTI